MRRRANVDINHREIVAALRSIGATVQDLAAVGRGCPDLLVGYRGQNWLIEVKRADNGPKKAALRPEQATWHDAWRGQTAVAHSIDEALRAIGAL